MTVSFDPIKATGNVIKLERTDPLHMDGSGRVLGTSAKKDDGFAQAMLKAIEGDSATMETLATAVSADTALAVDAVSGLPSDFIAEAIGSLDQVSAYQQESSLLTQALVTDPESVDAHDVTIAMAKANLSLNLARAVISRVTQAYRDLINSR
jgi:flagellar hook-basal body complex protein FliE